jgi:hypothetical protein
VAEDDSDPRQLKIVTDKGEGGWVGPWVRRFGCWVAVWVRRVQARSCPSMMANRSYYSCAGYMSQHVAGSLGPMAPCVVATRQCMLEEVNTSIARAAGWSTRHKCASVPAGQIFLRALQPEERTLWVTCLRQSIELYAQSQHMVEELKGKGLLPQQVMSGAGVSGCPCCPSCRFDVRVTCNNPTPPSAKVYPVYLVA